MSYTFLTTKREQDGRQIVQRPRVTDVIGHTLRGTFDDSNGVPDDFLQMLQDLDTVPDSVH